MSLSFSTYDFITMFTYDNCVSNLPWPVCASVKNHCLIVNSADTALKWNKMVQYLEIKVFLNYHSG